ncbi:MAG: substrate-binding domain-containing protein [Lentisphaeria bacterium]|jgi:hypothetical protein|nr:substrate-binding domain-containing protein [Lentisphaeria bacterium]NLZ61080.1 ABC transporter substrate-binding protein [Lentisphaerota bacterium]
MKGRGKTQYYLIPLLCLLLLLLVLHLSRQDESSSLGETQAAAELWLSCDPELEDLALAIMAAFQRRYRAEIVLLTQQKTALRPDLPPGEGLFLGLKINAESEKQPFVWLTELAQTRLVLIRNSKKTPAGLAATQLLLGDYRLAMPQNKDGLLGRVSELALQAQGLDWQQTYDRAAFHAEASGSLALSVALGSADMALVWESSAKQYIHMPEIETLPLPQSYPVQLYFASETQEAGSREMRFLREFLQGKLSAVLLESYGFVKHPETDI